MCITHASSQDHPRLNLDTVSYNMLGADGDGEKEARGPWGWDCDRAVKRGGELDGIKTNPVF